MRVLPRNTTSIKTSGVPGAGCAACVGDVVRSFVQQRARTRCSKPGRLLLALMLAYSLGSLTNRVWAQDRMPIYRYGERPATESPSADKKAYTYVEKMPVYKDGGNEGLKNFFLTNFHLAPPPGTKGLFLSFVVGPSGKASNPVLLPPNASIPESTRQEALRVFSLLGEFAPGRHNGKPVDVVLTVPITAVSK